MAKDTERPYMVDNFTRITRKIEGYIVEHFKLIILMVIIITVGFGAYFFIDYFLSKKQEEADGLFGIVYIKYNAIINNKDLSEEKKNKELMKLVKEFQKVAPQYPGSRAGTRGAYFAGNILFKNGKYKEAISSYHAGYDNNKKIYLASLCLENEAYCWEELEDYAKSEALLKKIIEEYKNSYIIPSVLFSLGQLYERENKMELAEKTYSEIVSNYHWSGWKDFAEKRILLVKNFM